MRVLAIDPGTTHSAYVILEDGRIREHDKLANEQLVRWIGNQMRCELVIERIASYGMPIGVETMETIFWSGRFAQAWGRPFHRVTRKEVVVHLCGSARAKDSNVRQALIDRLGPPGRKAKPGPTYGITADTWAALAVAVTWWDRAKSVKNVEQTTGNFYAA